MAKQTVVLPANVQNALKYLNDSGAKAFLKKFRDQSGDERQLEAIWKECPENQAAFLTFFGYLNGGCRLSLLGRRRRAIC